MYMKDCDELTPKQKEELKKVIFFIYECIRTHKWEELNSGMYSMELSPDEVLFAVDDYYQKPTEVTPCDFDALAETIRPGRIRGTTDKWDTLSLLWLDGEESDLSMLCEFTFKDETIVAAVLQEVHVF